MPYTILRFKKDKGGAIAGCERHNERKKEAYKSNPDIDISRTKISVVFKEMVKDEILQEFHKELI